jgi:hypothetical protein
VYVWYKVTGDRQAAAAAIGALLSAVSERTGVTGRLLARCDDTATWMEVYENVGDAEGFARALAELAQQCGAIGATAGERHVECFAAMPGATGAAQR